ncbi:MAG: serine protease [Bdellovibrionales bacterium]
MNPLKLASMAVLVFSMNVQAKIAPTIVGGGEASRGEFPFIVSLHERWGHICGGSLINKDWVLTAGHCVTGTNITKVYIGLHDQNDKSGAEAIAPAQIIRHPQYNDGTIDYDYALIRLSRSSSYAPVEFAEQEIDISEDPSLAPVATVAGWGETRVSSPLSSATRLQKVDVPLVTAKVCDGSYAGQITDRMICAGYPQGQKDACFGDSGGPLVVQESATGKTVLAGVVSWGEGCARAGKYGVYSKVSAAADWIKQTAGLGSN